MLSSFPKTTRPPASSQRPSNSGTTAKKISRKMDAFPDKIDVRDWFYQPRLQALPDQIINMDKVPLILDQGEEGACTGFALAAVINYHLTLNGRFSKTAIKKQSVSPRMLYEMARRYDEWPGEKYEGSSARGTMKGWIAHGVASRRSWPDNLHGPSNLDEQKCREAQLVPAGAYYRVLHRQVRDMHSALNEAGILYATIMVHEGWNQENLVLIKKYKAGNKSYRLPVIERKKRADSGHAIAIVGYTTDGFIIQNSWGKSWGINGFALLPYEDWMLHASDCWVAQIGVPIEADLWNTGYADTNAGKQRAGQMIPLEAIRPYVINIGNNGYFSDSGDYWTTEKDISRLFETIADISGKWKKKRIMLYLHGGLNSEREVAKRIVSFKQVCLDNEIYPLHIMWETDFWTSLKNNLFDIFTTDDKATISWIDKLRSSTLEIKDRTFELTASKPGTILWDEMKENAKLASSKNRSMEYLAATALTAFRNPDLRINDWELHIVAHSAGSIFAAYAIEILLRTGVPIKSLQFLAPAISISLFKEKLLPLIKNNVCPVPTNYILSDTGELDDDVGPYGKSLLYLVSNAFESTRETAILGMERFINDNNSVLNKNIMDKDVCDLFSRKVKGWPSLVIAGMAPATREVGADVCRAETHGGFDNDKYTLNSMLHRILGKKPKRLFEARDLQ